MATITPTAVTLPGSITVPADGENINAADVNGPFQHIADGVKHVQNRTDVLADLTALAAILAPTDGLGRHVLGQGDYVFKTSATTGLSPFRVAAADATVGGWVSSTAHQETLVRIYHPAFLAAYQSSAAITPVLDPAGTPCIATDVLFQRGAATFASVVTGSDTAHALVMKLDDALIDGATLSSLRIRWKPNPTHVSLPGLMPKYGVGRVSITGNVGTALYSTGGGLRTDASADIAAYNPEHWNSFAPDQHSVIDKTNFGYHLTVYNEGGANSLAASIYAIEVTQTIPDARRA